MTGFDVSPAELQSTKRFVDKVAQDVVTEVSSLGRTVDAMLDGGWSGAAATSFEGGWAEWLTGARHVLHALDGMASLLGVAGRDYEDSDSFVASQFEKFAH